MKLKLVSKGAQAQEVEASDATFAREYNESLVHQVVVAYMAAYALRVRDGSAPGPYTHERAERFARLAMIDDDRFQMLDANELPDYLIAGHFAVPVEQVEAKRQDLRVG